MSLPSYYSKSPVFIQNILLNIQGYLTHKRRFGKGFTKELEYYIASNPQQIDVRRLHEFLVTAQQSKFWRKRFKEFEVNLESEDILNEISKLPILTKNEVIENAENIKINSIASKISKVNTSGTTGAGLIFQQTAEMENRQWAIWWRYRKRFGIGQNEMMGWFGGRSIVPIDQKKPPYWRNNYFMKQLMFSAHHLNRSTVADYYNKLLTSRIRWLHGYPSQLAYFAELILEADLSPSKQIQYITLGAENLLEHQKEKIRAVFGVNPIQHYGLAEGVANISELPNGSFECDLDFAYMEFIPSQISPDVYRLIGTNYNNRSFPLIRYDTNDLVTGHFHNRDFKVISIDGRNEDFVTLPSGVKLGRLDHIFKDANYLKEAQIYQPAISKIVLRLVKGKTYDENLHNDIILKEARERLGQEVDIKLEFMTEIPKTNSGKLKFVISDIK
ncbi:phenylacetate--CoA ligase family protein [Kaistella pullorum]|uniref:Uncharacterized protein n=1 Tax=Kaistella pullorum TaxID=2763074 RepID=A0ABR8WJT8_9FLAO|nr:hypothetical protein [Kaistella pullorum]MBD8017021.1 hypothetical protein [Kaistella pullorum]